MESYFTLSWTKPSLKVAGGEDANFITKIEFSGSNEKAE